MRIHSIAAAVPKAVIRNEEMTSVFGAETVEKIIAGTGVREHRRAPSNLCSSDLCAAAAEEILQKGEIPRDSIDAILFVSQTPDYAYIPQTSPLLARRLGLSDHLFATDLRPGCTGFTDGLILADSMIRSGHFHRILLLAGDTLSKHISPNDQGTTLLFGDAGSAALLEETVSESDSEFYFHTGTDGTEADIIMIPHGDRNGFSSSEYLQLDGPKVFAFTINRIPSLVDELLRKAGWMMDDVTGFFFHQANAYILNYLARKCRIPKEKLPMNIERYGNTSSASIPLTLADCCHQTLKKGDRLVFVGFGVGLLWSAVALPWDGGNVYPVIEI